MTVKFVLESSLIFSGCLRGIRVNVGNEWNGMNGKNVLKTFSFEKVQGNQKCILQQN